MADRPAHSEGWLHVSEAELRAAVIAEFMDYFSDPYSTELTDPEFHARFVAGDIIRRLHSQDGQS